jgi:hypothetical protein
MDGPIAGVAKHLKGFPGRYAQLKMPWFSQMQILDQPVLELNPLNFLLFFLFINFPPAKTVLSTRSSNSSEFYAIKNVSGKKKDYNCINFKKE